MKFCSKCGAQMEDDNMFCPECGTKQEANTAQESQTAEQFTYDSVAPTPVPQQTAQNSQASDVMGTVNEKAKEAADKAKDVADEAVKKVGDVIGKFDKNGKVNKKFMPFIAGGIAVLVVVILVVFFRSFVGSGSLTVNGAVKSYFSAIAKQDAGDYISATMSSKVKKAVKEMGGFDSNAELREEMEDYLEYTETKYRRISVEDKDKVKSKEVRELIEEIEDESDVKVTMSKVYEVEVEYEYKSEYTDGWQDGSATLYVYKASGNWYVFPSML